MTFNEAIDIGNNILAELKDTEGSMKLDIYKAFIGKSISALEYTKYTTALHDCNDCKAKKDCPKAPKIGQQTRINCFAWVGKENK